MKSVESKREREKKTVSFMITLYCKKNHGSDDKGAESGEISGKHRTVKKRFQLCPECAALHEYAMLRSDKCPFMETKTFCSNCKVHCYQPQMREQIRKVMRFSGPRMLFYHPIMAIRHVIENKREKKRQES